jgi:hypothetical protein
MTRLPPNPPSRFPNPFPGFRPVPVVPAVAPGPKAGRSGALVSVVLDESGSMLRNQMPTISGFNEFKDGQRQADGVCLLTLTKFSTPNGRENINIIFNALPVQNVPDLTEDTYRPLGNTPLYDAIGDTITAIDEKLNAIPENERPSVLVMIMTDGQENSSRRFNLQQIKELIRERESKDWLFSFLGANIDAFAVGATMGFTTANTVAYNTDNMGGTMAAMSSSTTRYRAARAAGASNADILSKGLYTDDERKKSK